MSKVSGFQWAEVSHGYRALSGCLEPDVHGRAEAHPALQWEAQLLGDGRPAAVGTDRVFGAGGPLANHGMHPILVLGYLHQFGGEPDVGVRSRGPEAPRVSFVLRQVTCALTVCSDPYT